MISSMWTICVRRRKMAWTSFHKTLAVFTVILFALVIPPVCGIGCSGDGTVTDTCPESEYCDNDECHNCSLCSVDSLLQGRTLTKCLCVETSAKICDDTMVESGKQLIEDPSQLSFPNLTGYENIDLEYLKESYDRSSIDCTLPTTKAPSTRHMTSLSPSTAEMTSEDHTVSSSTETAVTTDSSHGKPNVIVIVLGVALGIVVIIVLILIVYIVRIRCQKPSKGKKQQEYQLVDRGGMESGDAATGGAATGGAAAGGAATGGVATGGAGVGAGETDNAESNDAETGNAAKGDAGTSGAQGDGREQDDAETVF